MGRQNKEPDHLGIIAFQNIANRKKIAERLAHLLLVDIDKAVMQPVFDKRLTGSTL